MFTPSDKAILHLTAADVAGWQAEIARLRGVIADSERLITHYGEKIKAVRVLTGEADDQLPEPSSEHGITAKTTLTGAVALLLTRETVGRTTRELVDMLKQTPIAPKIIRSPGAIYTAIKRMVGLNEIVLHGTLLYSRDAFERVRTGDVIDPRFASATDEKPGLRKLILTTMEGWEDGMTANEVRDALADDPVYGAKVRARPNYIYNTLHRMIESTQLRREGNRYLVNAKAPPSGEGGA